MSVYVRVCLYVCLYVCVRTRTTRLQNSRRQVVVTTKRYKMAPNVCGYSEYHLLHVTFQAPRTLEFEVIAGILENLCSPGIRYMNILHVHACKAAFM